MILDGYWVSPPFLRMTAYLSFREIGTVKVDAADIGAFSNGPFLADLHAGLDHAPQLSIRSCRSCWKNCRRAVSKVGQPDYADRFHAAIHVIGSAAAMNMYVDEPWRDISVLQFVYRAVKPGRCLRLNRLDSSFFNNQKRVAQDGVGKNQRAANAKPVTHSFEYRSGPKLAATD
jgi:hypothetical protein